MSPAQTVYGCTAADVLAPVLARSLGETDNHSRRRTGLRRSRRRHIRWLGIALASVAVLLGACSNTTSARAYRDTAAKLTNRYVDTVNTISALHQAVNLSEAAWRIRYRAALHDLRALNADAARLPAPPPCYTTAHEHLQTAATAFASLVTHGEAGLASGDLQAFAEAHRTLGTGIDALNAAGRLLQNAKC